MAIQYLKVKNYVTNDLVASLVVFLVALPLCLGIAVASGVPPASGLVTGMVGGIIVGVISGSPLQVSGPAAGLAVSVWELVQHHGIEMLGPVILVAGFIQLLAGVLKLGEVFRAISPAVIYGMLSGIGVMLIGSQFHVMVDAKPHAHGLENLISIPVSICNIIFTGKGNNLMAGFIGIISIITLIAWDKFKPKQLKLLPGALMAVLVGTAITTVMKLPIQHVNVPENLAATIQFPTLDNLINLFHGRKLIDAIAIALIASAESLLSAAAVDRLHQGPRTNFNRELTAQGFGNMICGVLGAMPMTGVIARSSVNVEAMAKTRLSTILHGVWLLALVVAAPSLLKLVPTCSLAAILIVTGYKLLKVDNVRKLQQYGRTPLFIYFVTLGGIIASDLLTGVMIGLALSAIKLIHKISQLDIHVNTSQNNQRVDVYLKGTATFIGLPKLAKALEGISSGKEIYIHLEALGYIDHSCLDFLSMWEKQQHKLGNTVILHKDKLTSCYRKPFMEMNSEGAA